MEGEAAAGVLVATAERLALAAERLSKHLGTRILVDPPDPAHRPTGPRAQEPLEGPSWEFAESQAVERGRKLEADLLEAFGALQYAMGVLRGVAESYDGE